MKNLIAITFLVGCAGQAELVADKQGFVPTDGVEDTGTINTGTLDTDDTGPHDETIDDLAVFYLSSAIDCPQWEASIRIRVAGLPDDVQFDMYDTSGDGTYTESHTASLVSTTDRESLWELGFLAGGSYIDGYRSTFSCSDLDPRQRATSYSVRLYKDDELADCNAWGPDPEGIFDNEYRPLDVEFRTCDIID